MNLRVIATGSKGNCYILENEKEALIIECGIQVNKIKQAMNFNFSKVSGAMVTHCHNDHAVAINDVMKLGIDVYALPETFQAKPLNIKSSRQKEFIPLQEFNVGSFKVMAFDVRHDVPCVGFLIEHPECGKILFLTDTFYCPYTFPELNNIIIEANFSKKIIDQKLREGATIEFLRNRILKSHLSLENCKEALKKNDLSAVNNIVLIHLSDSNSNEAMFYNEVYELTGKKVTIANAGMNLPFNKTPF